jgi:CheY-like chemotaxis protein
MVPRVLLVAFDNLSNDLIHRSLKNAGFHAEIADTLPEAFAALAGRAADIVILDLDDPEGGGAAAARAFRAFARRAPRVVALSNRCDTLEAAEGKLFDALLAKPFNHDALVATARQMIAGATRWQVHGQSAKVWRNCGLTGRPKVYLAREPAPAEIEAIEWCFDIAEADEADAILAPRGCSRAEIEALRASVDGALLPVIDQSGELAGADVAFRASEIESWREVARALNLRGRERAKLSRRYLRAAAPEDRLLAGLFVSGGALKPARDPRRRECVSYLGFWPQSEIEVHAPRMKELGLLNQKFFDRMHACPTCRSRRLNVREECLKCGSADLAETAIVHHYVCQYQGPEGDFRRGAALVCPKCLTQLRHYGADYDKPGHVLVCGACGGGNSDAAVGFSCLDCGAHADGENCPTVDIHAYELTEAAVARLTRDVAPILIDDVPARVADHASALASREGAGVDELAIIEIGYGATSAGLPVEGLRAMLRQNLSDFIAGHGEVVEAEGRDYVIVSREGEESLEEFAAGLIDHCQRPLAKGLNPALRILQGVAA